MINAATESERPTTQTAIGQPSIFIARAIRYLFGSLCGVAILAIAGLASEPAPDGLPTSTPGITSSGPYLRGIDLSSSAGDPTYQNFDDIKQRGYRYVIVSGWGGVNRNHHARTQLNRARSAGLLTAGYCYLNFACDSDGASQVREALAAFEAEAAFLGFVAIDVESDAWNQLSPGLQREPAEASAQQQAVARIAEAVEEAQGAGLRAVIYTKKSYWKRVTGNTLAFSAIPLWWTQVGPASLNDPDLNSPSWTFGGWTNYVGKQCVLDTTLTASAIPVDVDIFDTAAFALSNPSYKPLPRDPGGIRVAVNP